MGDLQASRAHVEQNEESDLGDCSPEEVQVLKKIVRALKEQRDSERYCDITVKVAGKDFRAHKNVLAALSPCLAARISEDPLKFVLEMDWMSPEDFKVILDYAYGISITNTITDDNVKSLLRAASRLLIAPLTKTCAEYLGKTVDVSNMLKMYDLATEMSCADLAELVNQYARKNFPVVCEHTTFIELKPEQLVDIIKSDDFSVSEEVIFDSVVRWINHSEERKCLLPKILVYVRLALLSPDFLRKRFEEEELIRTSPTCVGWISEILLFKLGLGITEPQQSFTKPRFEPSSTEAFVVLGNTETGEKSMLAYSIDSETISTLKCTPLLRHDFTEWFPPVETFCLHREYLLGFHRGESTNQTAAPFEPRGNQQRKLGLATHCRTGLRILILYSLVQKRQLLPIFVNGDSWRAMFRSLDSRVFIPPWPDEWEGAASPGYLQISNRTLFASATNGEFAYFAARGYTPVLARYNSSSDDWISIDNKYGLSASGVAYLDGFLYSTVSKNSGGQPEMKRFDPDIKDWISMAKMPIPLWDCFIIALQDMICLIGGSCMDSTTNTVSYSRSLQRYNPQCNTWTLLNEGPFPRPAPGSESQKLLCCAFQGKIFVIDGTQNNKSGTLTKTYVCNVAQNTWTTGASLHQAYMNPSALMVLNGKLTFIDTSRFPYLQIEIYLPLKNCWEVLKKQVKLGNLKKNFHFVREAVKVPLLSTK